jgi:hypothetical protein
MGIFFKGQHCANLKKIFRTSIINTPDFEKPALFALSGHGIGAPTLAFQDILCCQVTHSNTKKNDGNGAGRHQNRRYQW